MCLYMFNIYIYLCVSVHLWNVNDFHMYLYQLMLYMNVYLYRNM